MRLLLIAFCAVMLVITHTSSQVASEEIDEPVILEQHQVVDPDGQRLGVTLAEISPGFGPVLVEYDNSVAFVVEFGTLCATLGQGTLGDVTVIRSGEVYEDTNCSTSSTCSAESPCKSGDTVVLNAGDVVIFQHGTDISLSNPDSKHPVLILATDLSADAPMPPGVLSAVATPSAGCQGGCWHW